MLLPSLRSKVTNERGAYYHFPSLSFVIIKKIAMGG